MSSAPRGGGFEAGRAKNYWNRRPWRWPSQRQRCERPRRQPPSQDRADGTSAGKTHVSRLVEDPSESVESEGYSGPSDPTEGAGTDPSCGTGLPPTGCSQNVSRNSPWVVIEISGTYLTSVLSEFSTICSTIALSPLPWMNCRRKLASADSTLLRSFARSLALLHINT